ncbi:reticulophagy regulator 2-like [Nilaparvata lugens]|uniref:reticulophagy regulator 2-like n=1 Tax=Nilaparvata lugens TaxID=108931 RepID=UPI00193DE801|nr:reticulophagy regulator 2-like [Nilaparvata lugens]
MAVFRNILRKAYFWKKFDDQNQVNKDKEDDTRTLRESSYVFHVQNVITWDNPSYSFLWIGLVNLLFWLSVILDYKAPAIVSTISLLICLHGMWTNKIWPEIRVKRCNEDEENRRRRSMNGSGDHGSPMLSEYLQSSWETCRNNFSKLLNMREQNKIQFFAVMAGMFIAIFMIGQMISGFLLTYLIVMAIMIGPGLWIHVLSKETKTWIINYVECLCNILNQTGDAANTEEEDEYMLEESGENMAVLSRFVDGEDTNDSFYSKGSATPLSFVTGVATMPSHDDISLDSMPSFSELDLALENSSQRTVILKDVEDFSDDSSSNDPAIMDFQSGHFNGNESSGDEEENMYARDLTFTETDCTHTSTEPAGISFSSVLTATTSNLGNLGAVVGQTLLTNVVNRALGYTGENQPKSGPEDQKLKMAKNDSSNSLSSNEDFELISHDEVS